MRSYWRGGALIQDDRCPYIIKGENLATETLREEKAMWWQRHSLRSRVLATPKARGSGRTPSADCKGSGPCRQTPASDVPPPGRERVDFCCFKSLVCDTLLQQPQETRRRIHRLGPHPMTVSSRLGPGFQLERLPGPRGGGTAPERAATAGLGQRGSFQVWLVHSSSVYNSLIVFKTL